MDRGLDDDPQTTQDSIIYFITIHTEKAIL